MKVSELIEVLQRKLVEDGDLPVHYYNEGWDSADVVDAVATLDGKIEDTGYGQPSTRPEGEYILLHIT